MNIADTSNNGTARETINSANSPNLEQANCPFYSVLNDQSKVVRDLPLLNPATDVYEEPPMCESSANQDVQDQSQQDWVAEPNIEQQMQVDSEFQKLLTLNEQLHTANTNLYAQVEQLKQELAEAEKILQWQKKRSTVTESLLNQQAQDLANSQEQIQSLFQQLEVARQTVQSQAMFINTHKSQLQISQERVALLERECTLLQTKYSEQSQDLLHSENTCRELRTRLIRQQRQTLQFKAALDKCLDTSVPSYDTLDDTAHHPYNVTSRSTRFSRKARSLFPHAQPIQPWSAEGSGVVDTFDGVSQHLENSWIQSPTSSVCSSDFSHHVPSSDVFTDVNYEPELDAAVMDSPPVQESNLDRQLESLIEMFFASSTSTNPSPVSEGSHHTPNHTRMDQSREVIPTNSTQEQSADPNFNSNNFDNSDTSSLTELSLTLGYESSVNASVSEQSAQFSHNSNNSENEDYWSDLPVNDYYLDYKSPSPLIYPQRPPKGRKSFASVELPNFRPKVQGQGSNE
ncbi:MAG: hypothetical protein EAZ76_08605 [Nostocales cyanobacterium]|nr:MAG: hypothetical protein EAZ87_22850 [Nostocales cyanobacterium]TAF15391.1 MAG: hypothetical protein EAZ76_08605 [Nostocales cyanobacterium]